VHHEINFETITNLMHKYLYSYNITTLYMFRALLFNIFHTVVLDKSACLIQPSNTTTAES